MSIYSLGLGVGTQNSNKEWLEVFYAQPQLAPTSNIAKAFQESVAYESGNVAVEVSSEQLEMLIEKLKVLENAAAQDLYRQAVALLGAKRPVVVTILGENSPPENVPAAYLKLHLLSHRLVKPHETDLSGVFGCLPNVAWTNLGAIDIQELNQRQLDARARGEHISVDCIDKFPKMTDYIVPEGVRIADTARVRLGAHIGKGTTIMHEGFVNFNAGTLGTSMVEGRISAGVIIGEGSDVGGGASIMGTLSGGGSMMISVGKECLLGANSGLGIPLGDRCTIESGLYVTAGTKVTLIDKNTKEETTVKARELAGNSDMLFIRNSISGRVECRTNTKAVVLNEALHAAN